MHKQDCKHLTQKDTHLFYEVDLLMAKRWAINLKTNNIANRSDVAATVPQWYLIRCEKEPQNGLRLPLSLGD